MQRTSSGLLANPDFIRLWFGQTISEFGSRITRDALPILAVVVLNATPAQMGWLSAATSVPVLVFGLLAGVWVDRLRRRPLMIAADVSRMLLLLIVPLAYLGGWLNLTLVFVVAGLMSILGMLFETAYRALLPTIVHRGSLLEANSKLSTTDSLAEIGGPAITGLLVQVLTAPLAILFDALSYIASILCLARIRTPEPPPSPHEDRSGIWREIVEGFKTLRADPILLSLAVITSTHAFFGAGIGALYSLFTLREIGLTPALLGLLVSTGGIGALVGALTTERLTRWFGAGRALVFALLVNGLIAFCIPLAGSLPALALALLVAGQIIGDGAMMVFFINRTSIQQLRTPDRLLRRVNASVGFLAEGIAPIGAVVSGLLAAQIGIQSMLWIVAVGIFATALYALASPLRKITE